MQPLRDAIKSKYGVSDSEANQVIAALAEVEKHRQDAAGSQVQGLRARQPGDPTGGKVEIPDIDTIIGRSTNSSSSSSRSTSVNGTGLIGIILMIIKVVMSLFMARQQTQSGSGAVTSILTDLLGGATNPSQAPDLTNIIGGLLGGGQSDQVNEIANSMLGNQPQKGRLTGPKSSQR